MHTPLAVPRAVGGLLVLGGLTALVGAVTPPYRQWMAVSTEEYLSLVHEHPRWVLLHASMAAGSVITAVGLAGLGSALYGTKRGWLASAASSLFAMATPLWLAEVAHRLTITRWAGAELVRTGRVPELFTQTRDWAGLLVGAHMVLSHVAVAALGIALLAAPRVPRWAAISATVLGILAVPGLATPVFEAPIMIYLAPSLVGVAILSRRDRAYPRRGVVRPRLEQEETPHHDESSRIP